MQNKINLLLDFLKDNRSYNKTIQERYNLDTILPYRTKDEKILSLLYDIVNTQIQPNIDNVAEFFQKLESEKKVLNSFASFVKYLNPNSKEVNYNALYEGLKKQKGWGEKTAALFVKNIYHFHNGNYSQKLYIWDDAPKTIAENDKIYLPVDSVIIAIFNKLFPETIWNFTKINKLMNVFDNDKKEIFDDLWFWGFITQKGSGSSRVHQWNENKYWMIKVASKDKKIIEEIRYKSETMYLKIINDTK